MTISVARITEWIVVLTFVASGAIWAGGINEKVLAQSQRPDPTAEIATLTTEVANLKTTVDKFDQKLEKILEEMRKQQRERTR